MSSVFISKRPTVFLYFFIFSSISEDTPFNLSVSSSSSGDSMINLELLRMRKS
ncbi:hypothetical protein OMAG_002823 [Candidatus Omnitrophus magneticus]|uniref:Uncharacterized protein n=1 Tax=Candidatus Omnitrophus magneticus TaxID=1609969 RepID=A0A0F0CMU3_9BACT|nr:hypothetical protein OMAG_002823 [Candidatus Omnitrophus magneticus]